MCDDIALLHGTARTKNPEKDKGLLCVSTVIGVYFETASGQIWRSICSVTTTTGFVVLGQTIDMGVYVYGQTKLADCNLADNWHAQTAILSPQVAKYFITTRAKRWEVRDGTTVLTPTWHQSPLFIDNVECAGHTATATATAAPGKSYVSGCDQPVWGCNGFSMLHCGLLYWNRPAVVTSVIYGGLERKRRLE